MAVNAIEPVLAQKKPADSDRMLLIWRTAGAIIQSAADFGQFDLAMGLVSSFEPNYSGIETGPLFVAMKLAGREKDFPPEMAQDPSARHVYGAGACRQRARRGFRRVRQIPQTLRLRPRGHADGRRPDGWTCGQGARGPCALHRRRPDQRGDRTLEMLLLARRMDASKPMFAHLDLATPDGVAACARIAEGTKDRAIAEQCADALDGLPPKAKADYFGAGTVIPEVVGALAAVGNWEQALALIRAQPRDIRRPRSSSSLNMAIRPSCFRSPGKSLCPARPRAARIWSGCWSLWTTGGSGVLHRDGA